ncbi:MULTISPECIES: M23 family metallopeptidase [Paenibacillus]|uniref:Peptidoglycan DD-metalloendopeptidase family protein n=1 Tax=Paenibacillus campinasensis TaxID=66347 RepID=A0ABW9T3W0_9BACL|nr:MULTISPECIES: M23 family metallopeptidase [Paenibacillus]MUG67784.1 peptidoglycan DD-metalloendopeptidase family protein [Paenibacillus campinasensis]PAK48109.1 peptidase M23 [Paenibacillus sp. 7541]
MDIKSSVRHRREARIRELLEGGAGQDDGFELTPTVRDHSQEPGQRTSGVRAVQEAPSPRPGGRLEPLAAGDEPDPEKLWKQRYRSWYGPPGADPEDPGEPPRRASFMNSLLRRLVVSTLVFGLVWGVFNIQHPWAVRAQAFVIESLSREMDFQAAQAWYEDHFGGAPSFIPIFGQTEGSSTKVNAHSTLAAPLEGRLVQSFAVDLKGIVLEATGGSLANREVRSIETGRVLEVKETPDNGYTIVIQHTGERRAMYSRLGETHLKVNDWVEGGEVIGILSLSEAGGLPALYFELKEGNRSVDPAEVIPFD